MFHQRLELSGLSWIFGVMHAKKSIGFILVFGNVEFIIIIIVVVSSYFNVANVAVEFVASHLRAADQANERSWHPVRMARFLPDDVLATLFLHFETIPSKSCLPCRRCPNKSVLSLWHPCV